MNSIDVVVMLQETPLKRRLKPKRVKGKVQKENAKNRARREEGEEERKQEEEEVKYEDEEKRRQEEERKHDEDRRQDEERRNEEEEAAYHELEQNGQKEKASTALLPRKRGKLKRRSKVKEESLILPESLDTDDSKHSSGMQSRLLTSMPIHISQLVQTVAATKDISTDYVKQPEFQA